MHTCVAAAAAAAAATNECLLTMTSSFNVGYQRVDTSGMPAMNDMMKGDPNMMKGNMKGHGATQNSKCIHICIHMCIYIYICIYIYVHVCVYVCICMFVHKTV